ncbi:MAG: class I SAM-dependent methyltransferase [Acidobacteriota bacterium]
MLPDELSAYLGRIDIYLLDQVLRGHILPGMRIMDVGCGHGRNVVYFLRSGFDVAGLDPNPLAIETARALALELAPRLPSDAFRLETAESSTFPDACADVVISNAVLHFARDFEHFQAQLDGAWRLLDEGGLFFARMASSIGLGRPVQHPDGALGQPEGSGGFLANLETLLAATERLGGELVDPIKTTNVQEMRAMTTWVLRKR